VIVASAWRRKVPVAAGVGEPGDLLRVVLQALVHGHQVDAADGALLSELVAVEHLDADWLASGTCLGDRRVRVVVGIAERPLPQANIAGGNVQVSRLKAHFVDRNVIDGAGEDARPDRPRAHDGDAGADVAEADRQVDDPVDVLYNPAATVNHDPMLVDEHYLLLGVVDSGLHQHGSALIDERGLGDPRRPVGGPQ
jgi:hypothetical protein